MEDSIVMTKSWETYEDVARYLLNQYAKEFNLSGVEGKQQIEGEQTGATWEIDAKGIKEGNEGIVVIECKRHTTNKLNQETLGGLAHRITDTGAESGIIVSPLGLQDGASRVASARDILDVKLNANCTPTEFVMQFLNKLMVGVETKLPITDRVMKVQLERSCKKCGTRFIVQNNEDECSECCD